MQKFYIEREQNLDFSKIGTGNQLLVTGQLFLEKLDTGNWLLLSNRANYKIISTKYFNLLRCLYFDENHSFVKQSNIGHAHNLC